MSADTIIASNYVKYLKEKFSGLDVPMYKLREFYSAKDQVFFDCESQDKGPCLETILKQRVFDAFIVFIVIKEPSGSFKFMDLNFKNIGSEKLEHFIERFHKTLEPATKLSIQISGSEYVECIGHSYSDT